MKKTTKASTKLKPTQRLSLFFFRKPRTTALIWLVVALLGIASYTTLLKREGFPSISTPFAIAQGSYIVNNPTKVDAEVAKPLNAFLLKQDGVKSVQTQSFGNFYTAIVSYKDDVNADDRSAELQKEVAKQNILPAQATLNINAYKFGYTVRGDNIVISFYSDKQASTPELVAQAKQAATFIESQNLSLVKDVSVIDPYEQAINPLTGQSELTQKSFDRYGERTNNTTNFYTTAVIGVQAQPAADQIELGKQIDSAVTKLNSAEDFKGFHAVVSASDGPQIKAQISELQKSLLEGLLAILIVSSIVIALRASLITVISMATVVIATNAIMYLIGYSLNTITLFALILGLALIVDDTIIMVEAIDSQRRKRKDPEEAVTVATGKISKAMIAATSTAALSFAPLIFVGGILGSFIRAIPVTIIISLVVSLLVALIFIPLFARYILLTKKQMGPKSHAEAAAGIEAKIALFISKPMLWAKNSRKKLVGVGLVAVFIGTGFIMGGGYLFSKVTFNIFPPSKDSDQISVTLTMPPNTNIEQAQQIADDADQIVNKSLDTNFVKASYYGQADIQKATLQINLISYNDRNTTAPELIEQLEGDFKNFNEAFVEVGQIDAGPPGSAFTAQVESSTNREGAIKLADDITAYLKKAEIKRVDGTVAKVSSVSVSNSSIYNRKDNKQYVEVTAKYVDTDTTTLLTLTKTAVEKEFPESRVESYGLNKDALGFDFGQESENQDSFKTLAIAFPILLCVIYVLLAFQFRSMLQPLLIFLAIPFSLFGITLGLYLTDNAFSFFAALGFFALIGLSLKNTILLTDYANQARREGMGAVDAAHEALAERFRPLIATSLTAVASLIPLALTSPFWEGLAVVLVGGLLSSTFLVLTVFPYYYLGSEFLRTRINRKKGISWLVLTIGLLILLPKLAPIAAILAPFLAALIVKLVGKLFRKKK
ncbi:MAG: efflux RND transporter permease subunit [Patescibacteria group bacterium]